MIPSNIGINNEYLKLLNVLLTFSSKFILSYELFILFNIGQKLFILFNLDTFIGDTVCIILSFFV